MNKLFLIVPFIFLLSCSKPEGEGGSSKITGKIVLDNYNNSGVFVSSYPAQDYEVYIIYGDDDNVVDDRVRTSYDGTFEFNYLREGTYSIFAYSQCISCPNGQDSVVTITVNIDSRKSVNDIGEITVNG